MDRKRALDLTLALPALVASAPLLALAAAGIARASRGPVWFVQERPGRDGRTVRIPKLRTLHVDGAQRLQALLEGDPELARRWRRDNYLAHDPRIAGKAGLLARRYGVDELPQLWSVVRGELSLVGPRPIERHLLESLFSERERALRQAATPGLTGLWQVRRREASVRSLRRYDLLYLRRRSLRLDLWILCQTPRALLAGRGA